MTVSPRYDQYKDAWDTEVEIEVYSSLHANFIFHFHPGGFTLIAIFYV
jgi:hypothetical protein